MQFQTIHDTGRLKVLTHTSTENFVVVFEGIRVPSRIPRCGSDSRTWLSIPSHLLSLSEWTQIFAPEIRLLTLDSIIFIKGFYLDWTIILDVISPTWPPAPFYNPLLITLLPGLRYETIGYQRATNRSTSYSISMPLRCPLMPKLLRLRKKPKCILASAKCVVWVAGLTRQGWA